jgi:hypothetical protein
MIGIGSPCGLRVWLAAVSISVLQTAEAATLTNAASVADGAGAWSSGGASSNIYALAQPSGISVSTDGILVNYAGFLGMVMLKPELDSDHNGCPDELDPDNDGDSLADSDEIVGAAFDPVTATDVNNPDSDNDGVSDCEESLAGTDPWDPQAFLRIVSLETSNSVTIAWLARSNYAYCIAWSTNLLETNGGFVGVDTVTVHAVASAPWYATTGEYTHVSGTVTNHAFYRIETR